MSSNPSGTIERTKAFEIDELNISSDENCVVIKVNRAIVLLLASHLIGCPRPPRDANCSNAWRAVRKLGYHLRQTIDFMYGKRPHQESPWPVYDGDDCVFQGLGDEAIENANIGESRVQ